MNPVLVQLAVIVVLIVGIRFPLAAASEPSTTLESKAKALQADLPIAILNGPTALVALAFSPDGSQIVTSSRSDVRLWDAETGKETRFLNTHGGHSVAFNRDVNCVALSDFATVVLHDVATDKDVMSFDTKLNWEAGFPWRPMIMEMAFSPNGRRLATAGGEAPNARRTTLFVGVVKLWNVETGKELARLGDLPNRSDSVVFSSDEKYLAAGTWGVPGELPKPGEVWVWDATNFKLFHTFKMKPEIIPGEEPCSVTCLAFNAQGTRLAAAVSDGTVHVWELPSGREALNQNGHQGAPGINEIDITGLVLGPRRAVRCVTFHPDGRRLALAGYNRVVRVWDSETGKETQAFRFDVPRINAVAFSPDGRQLAAAGGDSNKSGEAAIWQFARE
jgi:WD40 repeat protein